jgi:hypothetical protein
MATGTRATPITMAEKLNPNAELVVDTSRVPSPPRLQPRPTLGLYKQSSPSPVPTSAGSVRSQCHRTRYPTMSIGKLTTKRFPRSSVDRPEQQAICPRLPTPHRGSRRRTLLAILKPSPPGREFQPRGTCSRSYSDECSASRSISVLLGRAPSTNIWILGMELDAVSRNSNPTSVANHRRRCR